MRNQRQHGLGQTVQALTKSLQIYWEAYAFKGRRSSPSRGRLHRSGLSLFVSLAICLADARRATDVHTHLSMRTIMYSP
jgi:hypothetical protein